MITTTYDATGANQDRISSQTRGGVTTSYTYTNNGSLSGSSGPAAWAFAYDLQGNLRTASKPGTSITYLIDGQNRRVGKVGGTRPAKWLYDDQLRIAAELDATTGAITHVYAYGERSNVPELVYQPPPGSGKVYRIVSDWRGSVRLVLEIPTSGTPIVRQRIDYTDAWGTAVGAGLPGATEWTNLTGDATFKPVSLGFAGGLWDRDTGFVRFGARDYDPSTGRWTAKDPIRFEGGVNLYAYCENDPVNKLDPKGTDVGGAYDCISHADALQLAGDILASCSADCAKSASFWFPHVESECRRDCARAAVQLKDWYFAQPDCEDHHDTPCTGEECVCMAP